MNLNIYKHLCVPYLCLLTISSGCKNLNGEKEDFSFYADTVPQNYLHLLGINNTCCNATKKQIVFSKTTVNKYRKPVSCFYVAKNYYLQVYLMDSLFKGSLQNAIKESYEVAHTDFYTTYIADELTDMTFCYKHTKPKLLKKIFIDIYGNNTKIEQKNDSIAYYYSNCENFWVKFNPQDLNDIYGQVKDDSTAPVPLEIMFLRKVNSLYLLILSSVNSETPLKENTLMSIIEK